MKIVTKLFAISALSVIGIVGASWMFTSYLFKKAEIIAQADASKLSEGDAIFTLNYCTCNGIVSRIDQNRLNMAYELWKERARPIWVLGGPVYGQEHPNSYHSKKYLIEKGVPKKWIWSYDDYPFTTESVDTVTEVLTASQLVQKKGVKKLIVISEAAHLAQAKVLLDHLNISSYLVATEEASRFLNWFDRLKYQINRRGALTVTYFDRKGKSLFWVRAIRRPKNSEGMNRLD